MGVWAFYSTCSQEEIDHYKAGSETAFKNSQSLPIFEYKEMYKFWYGLHLTITDGLTEPTVDNLMSNAVAGQYHLYGEEDFDLGNDCWWWDFCSCGFNDKKRVKEISKLLNEVELNELIKSKSVGVSDDLKQTYLERVQKLREFYQSASENDLAVTVNFG